MPRRILKLVLVEREEHAYRVPHESIVSTEITDADFKQITFGKPFDILSEVKKLSERLDEQVGI